MKELCRKVWNEELVAALEARLQMIQSSSSTLYGNNKQLSQQQEVKRRQKKGGGAITNKRKICSMYKKSIIIIQATRPDIYVNNNNTECIVNLPTNKLEPEINKLCHNIIFGIEPIFPIGYKLYDPLRSICNVVDQTKKQNNDDDESDNRTNFLKDKQPTLLDNIPKSLLTDDDKSKIKDSSNPYLNDIYLNRIKKRGGSYAILVAFAINQRIDNATVLTKKQLCHIAQYHCDEEMTSNYSAGRVHSGWSSIKTLIKHNLISMYRHGNRPSSYTLTNNGILFIDALIEKNPSLRYEINDWIQTHHSNINQQPQNTSVDTIINQCTSETSETRVHHLPSNTSRTDEIKSDQSRIISKPNTSNPIVNPYAKNKLNESKKIGNITKNNNTTVELTGSLQCLSHNITKNVNVVRDTNSNQQQSLNNTNSDEVFMLKNGGNGYISNESNMKSNNQQAVVDCVHSTRAKQDCVFLTHDTDQDSNIASDQSCSSDLDIPLCKITGTIKSNIHECDDSASIDSQSTTELIKSIRRISLSPGLSERDRNTTSGSGIFGNTTVLVPKQLHGTTCTSRRDEMDEDDDASDDIDDDDDDGDNILGFQPFCNKKENTSTSRYIEEKILHTDQLTIYIDDRERNRNVTPRMLRTELARTLQSGFLQKYWPKQVPTALVKEKRLQSGDFSFETIDKNGIVSQLPVLVERKRVSDIVQRSSDKDHWYQLQRMDNVVTSIDQPNGTFFFLLEGDTHKAEQYSQQRSQAISDHTMCDSESLNRFICRAVIRCMFFSQYCYVSIHLFVTDPDLFRCFPFRW
jgi:hypothetical protein